MSEKHSIFRLFNENQKNLDEESSSVSFNKQAAQEIFDNAVQIIVEAEERIEKKRKEFENVKQCGARLTKHRFTY